MPTLLDFIPGADRARGRSAATWRGRCPFCEARRGLSATTETAHDVGGLWHCFACHEGGDGIEFVRLTQNVTYPEACQVLGLEPRSPDEEAERRAEHRKTLMHLRRYEAQRTEREVDATLARVQRALQAMPEAHRRLHRALTLTAIHTPFLRDQAVVALKALESDTIVADKSSTPA